MAQSSPPDFNSMKVADLRNLLAERGLPTTGKKSELIERLQGGASAAAADAIPNSNAASAPVVIKPDMTEEEKLAARKAKFGKP
ncbi:mitochondrial carrier domain-containing protein, putative [Eimeria mitis]|uniref:Mitochondrial carrier domain-containing protein, putative n=1 Tax=Eimeria mitis TaxID=44415 RepID=U6JV10_9EIME|nr:mitochondrial carrier domain-containing protein, putative [Eimeria mitis]CDJ28611.1 mitochondrial carrier domain-containing protein, putative [Eimeria mitis]